MRVMFDRRLRGAQAAQDVQILYRSLLGRTASQLEVQGQLAAGDWRATLQAIIASAEYADRTPVRRTPQEAMVNTWHPAFENFSVPVGSLSRDGSAVMGRSGWIFLITGSNSVLEQYGAAYSLTDGWHERWEGVVCVRQDGAKALGADLAMLVVPDKISVLADQLPPDITLVVRPPAERLARQFLGLRYPVGELQVVERAFLRTDTHLAPEGNAALAGVVLRDLGVDPGSLHGDAGAGSPYLASGDLGSRFDPPVVEIMGGPTSFGSARVVEDNRPQVAALGRHVGTRRVLANDSASDPRTVVVFGDSFAFAEPHYAGITWHLAQHFRSVHFVWAPFGWDPDYVEAVGAEAVVCETAERFVPRPPELRNSVDALVAAATAP